jgi:AraC-like DNA-binding protein
MNDFPLSRHAVFRSSDLDETRLQITDVLGARSLEFATADHRLDARLHAVSLPHILAVSITYGGDVVCVLDPVDDFFLVHVPMSGSMLVRGSRYEFWATPQRPSVISPPGPVTTTWDRDTTAMIFRFDRAAVEAELVDLIAMRGEEPLRFQSTMDATSEPLRSWRATAIFVASTLDADGGLLDHPKIVAHVERMLLRGLLLAQPHTYSAHLADDSSQSRPRHVTEAIVLMEDRPTHDFTVGNLARVVGVSARSLQDGFRQHLGMAPMQYLRVVRLRGARTDLLALDPDDPTTVAEVAVRWGFAHLGRFAQYYRSRYGEPPSRTLRGP